MKLKEIQVVFHDVLDNLYGFDEVNSFFYLLIESYFNLSRIQLALDPNISISEEQNNFLNDALEKLKEHTPIQYVIGKTEFYGLSFKVNQHTLIPRPETEELVKWVIDTAQKNKEGVINILDIGTGSGCIAIALAKNLPQSNIFAIDVSKDALKVAQENAKLNQVAINFIESNILNSDAARITKDISFDIIVSNPPYVRQLEKEEMKANVLQHEPHIALFVNNDNPLQFYKTISEFAVNNLTKKGQLFFEINEYLATEMEQLLEENQFNSIELKKDIFGKNRMIKGVKS